MKAFKFLYIFFFIISFFFSFTQNVSAGDDVIVHVFAREDCGFCKAEKEFLSELQSQKKGFEVKIYDLKNKEDRELFITLTSRLSLPKVTPLTIVNNYIIQGFDSKEGAGARIKDAIDKSEGKANLLLRDLSIDSVRGNLALTDSGCEGDTCGISPSDHNFVFKLPLFGVVYLRSFSLISLASILGFVDGFNPCAMWVLITFLIVLLQLGNKRKMFQVAGLFIFAEAMMYILILNFWYGAWDFISLDKIVTPIIGLVALGGGIFFLFRWFKSKNKPLVCDVTSFEKQSKIESRIHKFAASPMTFFVALSIIGLAFSVNIIEFACSIGIPQAFTKILEINNLSFWKTEFYMFIYALGYMVDDVVVFCLALYGFDKFHKAGAKYSRLSLLVGGVLMIILGALLIYKPSLLVF